MRTSMTLHRRSSRGQSWRFAARALGLAITLGGCAFGILGVVWSKGFAWELSAMFACVFGVSVVRRFRRQCFDPSGNQQREHTIYVHSSEKPGRLAWAVGVASTVALIGSCFALYVDAAYKLNVSWPIYAVAAAGIACAISWGYLASKMNWFM